LSRRPNPEERSILHGLFDRDLKRFTADPASARDLLTEGEAPLANNQSPPLLAAMTMVTRAVLNLHEVDTRN
jgi:hypothetical protein